MNVATPGKLSRFRQPVVPIGRARKGVGGTPRVSLLPGEVREAGAVAAHRYRLVAVVVVAALVAGGGVLLAQRAESAAADRLAAAQTRAADLGAQIAKFKDIRTLESDIALGTAAVKVGSSTMIDWASQIEAIEAAMPAGYTVTDISANGATPLAAYAQATNLLEPTRVATVTMKLRASSFGEEFSGWMRDLRSIPAYADASANTSFDSSSSTYTVDLTVHLNPKALSVGTWKDVR